jgi:thioredoxin 1
MAIKKLSPFALLVILLFSWMSLGNAEDKSPFLYLTTEKELEKVLKSEPRVLIDFYADWCGPCNEMVPELKALVKEDPKLKIVKINVDQASGLVETYKVDPIPALFVYINGKLTNSSEGYLKKEEIIELLSTNKFQ